MRSINVVANLTAKDLNEFKIADIVNLYVPPIIVIVGNICNILAILVMRSPHFRCLSTSVYMIACAVNDAVSLIISLTAHWVGVNFPDAIIRNDYSHYMCKFFNFYGWGNCDYTILLTAAMTADRAYAIMKPLKASTMNLVKRAKIIVTLLIVIVVIKEFHFLFSSDLVPPERTERLCSVVAPTDAYEYFYHKVWPGIHLSFLTVCFIIIISSNIIIIRNVRRSANMSDFKNRKLSTGNLSLTGNEFNSSNQSAQGRWRQMTTMLLAESFALILLTYPFSMHLSVIANIPDVYTDPVKNAANQLSFSVVFYLLYSNKCVNFCLYCVTGSRFRLALREILSCKSISIFFKSLRSTDRFSLSGSQTAISMISAASLEQRRPSTISITPT
ncbi:neuropeptides B/W receptor type 1-like [Patella vulgata]|uniref:neuropeptides B/W receptor type 1-like n=1 Tax=Patella vulgata TaxID=6465 RepID=UPI002180210D|nr:neuropeptides B/W receptor type 1-like [Patella vulgata]